MTSSPHLSRDEIVTEIEMSNHGRPWLILEGSTDELFFASRQLSKLPVSVAADGWENVVYIIDKVLEERISTKVFGFIDRDYREELGVSINENFIVVTDFRDLEISMFESKSLLRVVTEFGSGTKLPKCECGTTAVDLIRGRIYSTAEKLGKLRYYSLVSESHYPIKQLDYSKFIDQKSLSIDDAKLIQQINSKSKNKIDMKTLQQVWNLSLPARLIDTRNISSGHDIMEILGLSFKKLWGTNNSGSVEREKLESCFRIGYSDEEFSSSDMYVCLDSKLSNV